MDEKKSLQGRVIWITGSGRGIGRAAAIKLAARGATVLLSARTQKEIEDVAATIQAAGGQAYASACDVSRKDQVDHFIDSVLQRIGTVDTLINNAGIGIFKKVTELTEQDWEAMMQSNLKSAFLCTQAVLPDMIEKKTGHIINVISVAGRTPYYNCSGYCASKFGMLGFTEVLRLETRKHNIKVTSFFPGATDTAIWGQANVDRSKMMTPEEVADALVNVCCNDDRVMIEEVMLRPQWGDL